MVPEVPASWPGLSVQDLRVGASSIGETVSRQGGAAPGRHAAADGADGGLMPPEPARDQNPMASRSSSTVPRPGSVSALRMRRRLMALVRPGFP